MSINFNKKEQESRELVVAYIDSIRRNKLKLYLLYLLKLIIKSYYWLVIIVGSIVTPIIILGGFEFTIGVKTFKWAGLVELLLKPIAEWFYTP